MHYFEKSSEISFENLCKVHKSKANLEVVLSSQICVFWKVGLGYTPIFEKKAKKFSRFFSKSEPNVMPFISCNYCMKKGHVLKNCYARKYDVPKGFIKWIRKAKSCWTQPIKGYHVMLCCFAGHKT